MAAEILDGIVQVNSLEEVSVDMVRDFLQRREVKGIILGGSSPCQGNSFFNKGRRGTGDERTWQPLQLVRVRDELTSAFPSVRFLSFLENVASMPEDVRSMYSKLMAVEPIECCEGIFGWVRRSRLYWVAASGGFSASQRGLELPLGVQTSREGRRCVVQWRGKPIPGKMRAVDGSQLTTRKPQEVVNGNGEGGALSYHAGVSAPPTRRPRPQQMPRADGSKMAEDSHSLRTRQRTWCGEVQNGARSRPRRELHCMVFPGGGEAHADE